MLKSRSVRPTTGRVLNAVFSMLGPGGVEGADVLDAYAGTGAFGMRALEQGASSVDFIERDETLARRLRARIKERGVQERCRVLRANALTAIPRLNRGYGIIYIDPPYAADDLERLPAVLDRSRGIIAEGGATLFLEHAAGRASAEGVAGLARADTRRYGDSAVSVYRGGGGRHV